MQTDGQIDRQTQRHTHRHANCNTSAIIITTENFVKFGHLVFDMRTDRQTDTLIAILRPHRPHVEYCSSAWNRHDIKDKQLIEKVQSRFTKMIKNMEGKSYEERIHCLRLWSLEERRNRQDLIVVFKMCNGLSRLRLNELFTLDENNRGTRGHSWKLAKFRCTRDCCIFFKQNN